MAPDFTAPSSAGSQVHLQAMVGKAPIVLYFYPKTTLPAAPRRPAVCAMILRFSQAQRHVFGISYDSVESHKKFIEKYHLPFALLSDSDHAIAKLYGANSMLFAKRMTS